jgi:hypothetical protein
MRLHLYPIVAAALLLSTLPAWAGPGTDAYEAGDYKRALAILEPQAKNGKADAQYLLGRMRENGQGIEASRERALFWYAKAAAQGHVQAKAALESLGGPPPDTGPKPMVGAALSPPSALTPARPTAAPTESERLLAMLEGRLPYDRARAPQLVEALKRRAETGHAESAAVLGAYYESPLAGKPDFSVAARWYARAVELGYPLAANNLGALHYDGRGVPQNYAEAARLYRIAAEGGYAVAQYNLALMLGQGRGIAPDVPQMLDWLKKSAAQDYPRAQAQLARLTLDGLGVEKNPVEAGRLFLAAAQAGNANAQYWYGQLTATGSGVARDLVIGADWILKAADAGLPSAMQEAGAIYELGIGRSMDQARALAYYRKAGDAGVKEAAARLATAYANGELGLRQDTGEAARWAARSK